MAIITYIKHCRWSTRRSKWNTQWTQCNVHSW